MRFAPSASPKSQPSFFPHLSARSMAGDSQPTTILGRKLPYNEGFSKTLRDQNMDKVLIADIGVEGGGTMIYGRQLQGVWSFWTEGTSMDLDENDDEVLRSMFIEAGTQP